MSSKSRVGAAAGVARSAVDIREANSDGSWDWTSFQLGELSSSSIVALLRSVAMLSSSSVDDNEGKLIGPLLM